VLAAGVGVAAAVTEVSASWITIYLTKTVKAAATVAGL
jgi:hypothetical protein